MLKLVDGDVGGEMVDAVQRLVRAPIASPWPPRRRPAAPRRARGRGDRDRVDVGEARRRRSARARSIVGTIASRWARDGDLGNDPAETSVLLDRGGHRVGEQGRAADDADAGLVARGLDAEHQGAVAHCSSSPTHSGCEQSDQWERLIRSSTSRRSTERKARHSCIRHSLSGARAGGAIALAATAALVAGVTAPTNAAPESAEPAIGPRTSFTMAGRRILGHRRQGQGDPEPRHREGDGPHLLQRHERHRRQDGLALHQRDQGAHGRAGGLPRRGVHLGHRRRQGPRDRPRHRRHHAVELRHGGRRHGVRLRPHAAEHLGAGAALPGRAGHGRLRQRGCHQGLRGLRRSPAAATASGPPRSPT